MSDRQACLCCVHVLRRERPALLISNAAGVWQVMCGHDDHDFDRDDAEGDAKDAVAIHFARLVDDDPSLAALEELPADWSARRASFEAAWQPYHDPD